jgi:hypothetical protein
LCNPGGASESQACFYAGAAVNWFYNKVSQFTAARTPYQTRAAQSRPRWPQYPTTPKIKIMSAEIPKALYDFLKKSENLSIGYSEITYLEPDEVREQQAGYHDDAGSDWKSEWIVIASDQMGDPIFVDTSMDSLPVFTAMHGEGSWDPTRIADNLESFKVLVESLRKISVGRESPVELESNPIPKKDVDILIQEIEMTNPVSESSYWKIFLDQEN